jgi:hypothetical protein
MTFLQKRQPKHHSHRYFVDLNTGDAVCLCGRVRGAARVGKQKYNARTSIYNGYPYDSGLEAKVAMELDWRLKGGDIKGWERQYPIEIRSPHGELIRRHKVDFRVTLNDDSYELVEAKGMELPEYKLLRKLIELMWLPEHLDHTYTVVK